MNYFFMPAVDGLASSVTLSSFPPSGKLRQDFDKAHVYAAWSDGVGWRVHHLDILSVPALRNYTENDFPKDYDGRSARLFFLFPDELADDHLQSLPIRDTMASIPAWRANIRLSSSKTTVSYQGEYPDGMLKIMRGSLASISPLIQTTTDVTTSLIFTNLRQTAEIVEKTLLFGRLRSRQIVDERRVWTNTCNVLPLDGIRSDPDDPVCVFSPDIAGIPVYLSYTADYSELSFEHSHPPVELLAFGDFGHRMSTVGEMKRFWLTQMKKTS